MRVAVGSDVADLSGLAYMSATTTSTYGCVHRPGTDHAHPHRRDHGAAGATFGVPSVNSTPSMLAAYQLLPLQTVTCRGSERPSHLSLTVTDLSVSLTVTDLSVSIEPFSQAGPVEVHELPGTWTVQRSTAQKPGRR
jgi:hypothetical protein